MSNNKKDEKPKVSTTEHKLVRDVSVSGKVKKAGSKVKLSASGVIDFRRKNRIE